MPNDLSDVLCPSVWQAAGAQVADTVDHLLGMKLLSLSLHRGMTVLARSDVHLTAPLPNTHTHTTTTMCTLIRLPASPRPGITLGELVVSYALLWGTMRGDNLPLTTCCAAAWVQFQGQLSVTSPISPLALSIQKMHFLYVCNLQLRPGA